MVVRAVKDVAAGGEVFNCYGPHFRRMTRKERQEALSAQYSFTCRCEACLDVNSEDFQVPSTLSFEVSSLLILDFCFRM